MGLWEEAVSSGVVSGVKGGSLCFSSVAAFHPPSAKLHNFQARQSILTSPRSEVPLLCRIHAKTAISGRLLKAGVPTWVSLGCHQGSGMCPCPLLWLLPPQPFAAMLAARGSHPELWRRGSYSRGHLGQTSWQSTAGPALRTAGSVWPYMPCWPTGLTAGLFAHCWPQGLMFPGRHKAELGLRTSTSPSSPHTPLHPST